MIVVLALILVMAVPRIQKVIEESDKEAFRLTGENLVKIARDRQVIDSMNSPISKTYTITNGEFVGDILPMSGKLPDNGTIEIKQDGSISLVASNDKYCIIKSF